MINWSNVSNFKKTEFSADPDKYVEPVLIYCLDYLRTMLNKKIIPSPVNGSLARFGGSKTSQHYVGKLNEEIIRLSTACDVFIEGTTFSNFCTIMSSRLFNGIGIYLDSTGPDGKPWCMIHLDIRRVGFSALVPLIWIAEKDSQNKWSYKYPQYNIGQWDLFQDRKFFLTKKFGESF